MNPKKLFKELQSRPDAKRTLELLRQLAAMKLGSDDLIKLHDHLLFYRAYPLSKDIRSFCTVELQHFSQRIRKLGKRARESFEQTGIAGTKMYYAYDYSMAEWMRARLGNKIDIDWESYADREDDPLYDNMLLFLEHAAGDLLDAGETETQDLIEAARGNKTSLEWIMGRFDHAFSPKARDHLYNSMNLMLAMTLELPAPTRTLWDDGEPDQLYLWNPETSRIKFDFVSEILKPFPLLKPVPEKRAKELHDLAIGSLLPRLREYFMTINADTDRFYDVHLGRGVRMVLWFLKSDMRLPLEAGWGFSLLKNNVLLGYGGGGLLPHRSEFSLNIFETFRGGEAAWIYARIARIITTMTGAPWLVCRKYQVGGENNEEGLAAGSFWFYDKLGFRSTDKNIRKLADKERKKITADKSYRTPKKILKQLAEADLVISLKNEPTEKFKEFPLDKAGMLSTKTGATLCGGDHTKLDNAVHTKLKQRLGMSFLGWTADEKRWATQFGLFVLSVQGLEQWPKQDIKNLTALIRAKGSGSEENYIRLFPKNGKFFDALMKASEK